MDTIRRKAYAKINLGLDVLRRMENGYHEVKMIMQTIGLYDQIMIGTQNSHEIHVSTNLKYLPSDRENIAWRAVELMREEYYLQKGIEAPGAEIRIEKHIPVAAGMAGGSTDAAAVINGLNELWELGFDLKKRKEIGVRLGADVPYCITGGTMLSEGIGEILTPLDPMPNCFILTGNPHCSVSTRHVYENLKLDENTRHPDIDGIIYGLETADLGKITGSMGNLLETVTIPEHPEIDRIKQIMKENGALGTLMSGSGPTVFGIFERRSDATRAARQMEGEKLTHQTYITTPCNVKRS